MMPRIALLVLAGLAACASADSPSQEAAAAVPMQGWRMASGKPPSKAEFGAVVASCQDRARTAGAAFESCLGDLGLRRTP